MSESSEFRTLTEDETAELRSILHEALPALVEDAEDIADLLDYTFAMIANSKSVPYMEGELKELCSDDAAKRIGEILQRYFHKLEANDDSKRVTVKAIKASGDAAGNALTMSGALGSSRIGGKTNNKSQPKEVKPPTITPTTTPQPVTLKVKKPLMETNKQGGRGDRRKEIDKREGRGGGRAGTDIAQNRGGRAGRTAAAMERLTDPETRDKRRENVRGQDPGRGRGDDRGGRDIRGGRGGRGAGRGTEGQRSRNAGRDGRGGGRGESDRGRVSGQRRPRDDTEEQDFIAAPPAPGRGGGGRAGRFNDGGERHHEERGGRFNDGGAGRFNHGPGRERSNEGGQLNDNDVRTEGRGGRFGNRDAGRGGRFARGGPPDNKRQRREDGGDWHDGHEQVAWQQGGYDESYAGGYGGYDDGYAVGGYEGYDDSYGGRYGGGYEGFNDGWHSGRGRGGGRFGRGGDTGRFGRGGGRSGRGGDAGISAEHVIAAQGNSEGHVIEDTSGTEGFQNGAAAAGHPSPLVAAAYGGRGYGGRGGSFGRGRGGLGGYRAQVNTMIASKSWVRPKADEGGAGEGGEGAPAAEG